MRLEHVVGISTIERSVCDSMKFFRLACRVVGTGNRNVCIADWIPRMRSLMMDSCDLQGSRRC